MLVIKNTIVVHKNVKTADMEPVAMIANVDNLDASDNGNINMVLNEAFEKTNNIDCSWSREQFIGEEFNPDYYELLTVLAEGGRNREMGLRSTMMGDRIGVVIECTGSGQCATHWYEVDFAGFKRLYANDLVDQIKQAS